MAIDWETGKITKKQHVLSPELLARTVKEMEDRDIFYIDVTELSADRRRRLWVNPDAALYTDQEVKEADDIYFCRVIKIDKGLIVDASAGNFRLNPPDSDDSVSTSPVDDHAEEGWVKAIGLVGSELQREVLGNTLFEKYNIFLGQSALVALEASSDDS